MTRFRPSQPHLQRKKAPTRRRAVFTSATFNAPRTLGPSAGQRTACRRAQTPPLTRFKRRATAAAGEAHPRAKGLARAGAVQRRATRGGAHDARPNAGLTTLRRKWRPAGTCTSTSSPLSALRETTCETPRVEEVDQKMAGGRVSWSGVTRDFLGYTPSKVCRSVIVGFFVDQHEASSNEQTKRPFCYRVDTWQNTRFTEHAQTATSHSVP